MLGNLDPEVHNPVLEIHKVPEQGLVDPRVAVPALVLPSRTRVQVQDGVDALGRTGIDDLVYEAEAVGLDDGGAQVVHEVPVVYRDAQAVEAERRQELGVLGREEIV